MIDADDPIARAGLLAIRHAHTPYVSIDLRIVERRRYRALDGQPFCRIQDADVDEVSITDRPAVRGTWVRVSGQPAATVRSWPCDSGDRACLTRFLERAELDVPAFLPTVGASIPIVRTPRGKVDMARFEGLSLDELRRRKLTPAEWGAALDNILDG